MEYNEYKNAVYDALQNCDYDELRHLEYIDGTWYTLCFDELNESAGKSEVKDATSKCK